MAVPGLERHRLALLAAKEDVGNPRAGTNWAVFAYEKHHDLKLLDSGAGGPDELAGKFSPTSIMYGLCRIPVPGAHRIVLIHWVGEKAPDSQREACAGHLPTIRAFFKEASVVLSARRAEEVTQEGLSRALAQMAPPAGPPSLARRGPPPDTQELVGTNYRKTNPALEIRRTKRDSFWAQAEREEQQRREEERQRAREQRERWERERLAEERRGAAERERRCREKEREIEEQRKEQARLEAEERRKEKARWEQQQREHEEAMRERGRRSESIEKAAEAAVLVSQRSQNPRDFFRQRERSGSTSGTPLPVSPLGTRPGARRPFLRYQRSLTESAFIFRRPDPPPSPGPLHPGAFRAVPPPSPPRPQPALPTSPTGGDTPPCATLGSPSSPVGTGTSPCATLGSPSSPIGTGTPPCATKGSPPSPIGTGTPPWPGGQLEPAQGDSGHNGIGGHEQGGWPDPWDPPPGQGDESSDSILLPQPLHKATPGFALLLARAPPAPQLPGDPSPPAEDEDLSPHAM
ncbi:drebrin-like protein B [Podargus strigoides]